MPPLTKIKQEKFCLEYVNSGNLTQSVIKAGYKAKQPSVSGVQLLENTKVKARVRELQEQLSNQRIMSIQERKEILTALGRFGGKTSISAIAELNKMEGIYPTEKVDITTKGESIKGNGYIDIPDERFRDAFIILAKAGVAAINNN